MKRGTWTNAAPTSAVMIQHPAHKLTEIFYRVRFFNVKPKPKILLFRVLFHKTSLTQRYASIHYDA